MFTFKNHHEYLVIYLLMNFQPVQVSKMTGYTVMFFLVVCNSACHVLDPLQLIKVIFIDPHKEAVAVV